MGQRIRDWLLEARRRRVFRTTGVYVVAVWGLSQGAVELGPLFGAPDWLLRALLIAAVALLPGVVVLAWMFDVGRGGIVRDPEDARRRDRAEEDDLASMPTLLGSDSERGGVLVRWKDATGPGAVLFDDEFMIGRGSECRVRFYDPLVSRRHARVWREDGAWRIADLGSRNGTWVAGERIEDATLATRCEVRVNEAGPVLDLQVLAPGAETRRALDAQPPGPRVAHVREAKGRMTTPRSAATLES